MSEDKQIIIVEVQEEAINRWEKRYRLVVDGIGSHWWMQSLVTSTYPPYGNGEDITFWTAHAIWPGDLTPYQSVTYWDGMELLEGEPARRHVLERCIRETIADREAWTKEALDKMDTL